jgi:hypothetical protein
MMASSSRSLSATTRTPMTRKRLAVAAGSLVAVSVATASAFLVDTTAGNTQRHCPQRAKPGISSLGFSSNQLHSHRPEDSPSVVQLWLSEASPWILSTRMWSKIRADSDDDNDNDIDAKVVSARETIETAQAISETLRNRFKVGDSYVWLYHDVDGNPTSWEKYTVTGIEETKHNREREGGEDERPEFVATIEMSTKFEEDEAYQTHHRIKANLIDHVLESSESQEGWRIGFEFFLSDGDGGAWQNFGKGDNVQAFEEKFDVFSMVSAAAAVAANTAKATKGGAGDFTEDPRDECLVSWTIMPAKTHCDTDNYPSTRSASVGVTTKEGRSRSTEATTKLTAKLTQTKRHGYTESWYGPSNHDTLSGIALYKEFPNGQHSFSLIERTTRTASGAEVSTDAIEVIV